MYAVNADVTGSNGDALRVTPVAEGGRRRADPRRGRRRHAAGRIKRRRTATARRVALKSPAAPDPATPVTRSELLEDGCELIFQFVKLFHILVHICMAILHK